IAGHDFFINGGVFGFEAVVQEVCDVQGFAVEVDGKGLYSGVAAFYGDGIIVPGEAGFGMGGRFNVPAPYSVVL
ncbi:MAG: hypothetical protein LBP67_04050, partial [Bacteroidales bacterium]|nr:hypothetical protein [Bacteroidales bacterium]